MVAILLAGFVAYRQLPVSALPEVDYPTIQVVTFYPGASPDVMASSVTAPLERQFGEMPGLKQMTSTSSQWRLGHHAAVQPDRRHRRRRAGGAGGHQRGAELPARRSAQPADLQQGQSRRSADDDARADLGHPAAATRSKIWPTPAWRRRSRRSPASAWSPSPAARSRPSASRPTRRSSPPTASASRICAPRWAPPTSNRPRAT